ncbi:NAD(P)-dependent steroid dehydrogenase-like protein [Angomonas deanei]|uniref:3-beta hydroxysteroid dehydrogenase/isomerase domain-containing protein n=1 Tax=Angomonas deanei TaxID=59799 RepID=S9WVF2_9TRYP|nr:NAD(P)-dependent steroid dehydrogenase-like protein [Angomonas deanei]EPY34882.1 NAD(P)-dependent steroid dehydrogenase-like protein [Angomonas deanei]EPY43446.1 NAD(P)-dependent steroid dehydrogenase-like protein [Angomonas deanei]CAD2220099.1 Polysaccharide biosynthesis protein/NmrA-like family/NAD dependent epimerase/dehydratase family/RmlD substrate binding domain/3-beta hydroxysteroid dehydrogenase/isomerase family/Male sterility protein/GDP-mannose 4,6 dehydratase/NAD(P)H-binding, putat|eukprot:EPY32371.1 NAD(P)-dependent steroid dehydrogenase-like protein [Angomonas deanei]
MSFNTALSVRQKAAAQNKYPPVPKICVVTGGTGFVGTRLVEMLVERGAEKVICFDIVPKEKAVLVWDHPKIEYVVGDISVYSDVSNAIKGSDCVWHLAAAVGPFHPTHLYEKVNHLGTVNVIKACKEHGVKKLVFSSSPSTRFKGSLFHQPNVDGLTEEQMPKIPLKTYMQKYAETKAEGELEVTAACSDDFWAVAVAPHQVYGPRDNLFLPNMLEAAGTGKLRVFGKGDNRICFTHVDNYCHGLIIAERQLYKDSPVLGKFYIVTDGDTHPEPAAYCVFWKELDKAVVGMGFPSIQARIHYPFMFLYIVALFAEVLGMIMNTTFKLNVFNVFVLTMNRWFDISAAENDLKYQPIIPFDEGWQDTIEWFKANWLPKFQQQDHKSLVGISTSSQQKINIQAKK